MAASAKATARAPRRMRHPAPVAAVFWWFAAACPGPAAALRRLAGDWPGHAPLVKPKGDSGRGVDMLGLGARYSVKATLGKGSFGEVWLVTERGSPPRDWAAKLMERPSPDDVWCQAKRNMACVELTMLGLCARLRLPFNAYVHEAYDTWEAEVLWKAQPRSMVQAAAGAAAAAVPAVDSYDPGLPASGIYYDPWLPNFDSYEPGLPASGPFQHLVKPGLAISEANWGPREERPLEEEGASRPSLTQFEGTLFFMPAYNTTLGASALSKRSGRSSKADAIKAVAAQLALGLHALHAAGTMHRDFKADNVMFRDGSGLNVSIIDYGLAMMRSSDASYRRACQEATGVDVCAMPSDAGPGSPGYMPPSALLSSEPVSFEGDWWAYGVTLFELFYGYYPFGNARTNKDLAARMQRGFELPGTSQVQGMARDFLKGLVDYRRFERDLITPSARRRMQSLRAEEHPVLGHAYWLEGSSASSLTAFWVATCEEHAEFPDQQCGHLRGEPLKNLELAPTFCRAGC